MSNDYKFVEIGEQILEGDELLLCDSEDLPEDERWVYFIQDDEEPEFVGSYGEVRRKV